jgi:flagellar biogenesis protein FliO
MGIHLNNLNLALLTAAEETGSLGGTTGPDLTRYFAVCAVLIVATAALAWGMRKMITGNLKQRANKRSLQVIDVLGLGGKRKLAVIRCYDRTFVVGLGEREITPIAELDPVIGQEAAPQTPSPQDSAAFATALEQVSQALPPAPTAIRTLPTKDAPAGPRKVIKKRRKVKTKRVPANPAPRVTKESSEQRHRKAQSVASAALQIAEDKKRNGTVKPARPAAVAQSNTVTPSRTQPTSTRAPRAIPSPTQPASLQLEGVIG